MIDWTKTKIVAIAGLAGAGKTQWLREQLKDQTAAVTYFAPQTTDCPIDRHCLALDFPQWKFLAEGQELQLIEALQQGAIAVLELGFYVAPESGEQLLKTLEAEGFTCERFAFVSDQMANSPWHIWADDIIEVAMPLPSRNLEIWRSPTRGQVFDPDSLNIFWEELTGGAYGDIQRAKGVVEIVDGRAFYLDYVSHQPESLYRELAVKPWLDGRPERFSGLEVVGTKLDGKQIADTILDCCLNDELLDYYQAQIRQQIQQQQNKEAPAY
ncbi:MAG: GTP-binding protein [Limnothrix sp. RL_2_0]|nr:GTP-binding protein [Limnothrix sp. RL_2_0]